MHNKKSHIIEVAFALFYHKGIHAVGINEIIKSASIAKKTLYNHFKSKDDLIIATLIFRDQLEIKHVRLTLANAEVGKDALLVLFELLDDILNNRVTAFGDFRGDYFNNCCAEYTPTQPLIYETCRAHKASVRAIIQEHVDSFEVHPGKNSVLVNTLVLLKEGALNEALVSGNLHSAMEAGKSVENLLRFKR